MTNKTYEQIRDEAWNNILFYHGCLTGDCPHEISGQCYEALVKAGFDAATKYWRSLAPEFDVNECYEPFDKINSHGLLDAFIKGAHWLHDSLAPVIGALRAELAMRDASLADAANNAHTNDELQKEITALKLGMAHFKTEREIHDREQAVFVTEATKKIAALKAENKELKEIKHMYEGLCK